jgi:FAD/FMN-containing dehydrogenase
VIDGEAGSGAHSGRDDAGALDRRELLTRAGSGALLVAVPDDLLESAADWFDAHPSLSSRALRTLRGAVRGPVLTRSTVPYRTARLVYNQRFSGIRPQAIVQPLDTRDVQAVVRWADRFGVRLVARSGGHSYAGYSTLRKGVVVDLCRLGGVRVRGASGSATVGAGAQLIDVYASLARRGVTIPAGTCPSVGIGGLALGGGYGLASRRFGLTADNIRALTIVTTDGRARRVDRDSDRDLFWACRGGGGGNFGIVTGFEFGVHRARAASWFSISWPWGAAGQAIAAWQAFAPDAPDGLTSVLSLGTGGPRVSALGQYFGSPAALRRLVRPLTRVPGASLSVGSSAYFPLMLRWAGCLDDGLRACHTAGTRPGGRLPRAAFHAKSDYVGRPLSARARATMIRWIERRQRNPSLGSGALLLDAYGGAVNRVPEDATAFVHRDQLFSIQYLAYFGGEAAGRASRAWISAAHRAMRPFVSGQAYQNYIDAGLDSWQRAYYGRNLARLREVKARFDPDFRFRFPQAIPPA